jgi:hypothetical protein
MSLVGAYTRETVPDALLSLAVVGGVISLEVLNAGAMGGTGLTAEQAAEKGLMKNHWRWHAVVSGEKGRPLGVTFGFDPVEESSSVKSDAAQGGGSSRGRSSIGSDGDRFSLYGGDGNPVQYSPAGSEGKPPQYSPVGSKGKPSPLSDKGGAFKPYPLSDKGDALKPVVTEDASGAKIVSAPASISSTRGDVIHQPASGTPKPGVFNIKVVDRATTSFSAFVVFELPIRDKLTLGDLIHALDERHMEPFYFRKVSFAIFGCRDFM